MKAEKKKPIQQHQWEKTPEYREAILLKVIRAMKHYGYQDWMTAELKKLGLSI